MIQDLSLTLKNILEFNHADLAALAARLPELADAHIAFEHPQSPYNPAQSTINLFLYDIRENVELRSVEPVITKQNGKVITEAPALRVACSYLVTAWPGSAVMGEAAVLLEHTLLGQTLQLLSQFSTIPTQFLQGSLADQELPLPIAATHLAGVKDPAEFWGAMGNKLRPSLTVTATIAMKLAEPVEDFMVVTQSMKVGMIGQGGISEKYFRIRGRVTDASDKAIAGALITVIGLGLTATADDDGHYNLGPLAGGNYSLHVESLAGTKDINITVPADANHNYDVKFP